MNSQRKFDEKAVALSLLLRLWQLGRTPITMVCLIAWLTPEDQGAYYSIMSIVGMTVLFESGFGILTTQMVSAAAARSDASHRIASFHRTHRRFYATATLLFAVASLAWGFFLMRDHASPAISLALLLSVFFTAGYLWTNGHLAFLEGLGFNASVARWRLIGTVIGTLACWILLYMVGLLGIIAINGGLLVGGTICLWLHRAEFRRHAKTDRPAAFWKEIWPNQWRISLSWFCGYFIFQLATPLMLMLHGPAEAGRMGMAWSAAGAIPVIALTQVAPRLAQFSTLISSGSGAEAHAIFLRSSRKALVIAIGLGIAVLGGIVCLGSINPSWSSRFLDFPAMAILVIANVVYVDLSAKATLARAHGGDPFLVVSVVQLGANITLGYIGAMLWGGLGVAAAYLCTSVAGYLVGYRIYLRMVRPLTNAPHSGPPENNPACIRSYR